MRFLLLILFLALLPFLSNGQNWAPWPQNDTIRHFLCNQAIGGRGDISGIPIRPIQTVEIDSAYGVNPKVVLFKKGFNIRSGALRLSFPLGMPLEGKLIGDTALIYADSSILTTSDTNGFRLFFPHNLKVNDTFIVGKSNQILLEAVVDSIYLDSIGAALDSVAKISLFPKNKVTGIVDQNNIHYQHSIQLSKSHGFKEVVDFTEEIRGLYNLFGEITYSYFPSFQVGRIISEQENNQLTVGDEVHFEDGYDPGCFGPFRYPTLILKVIEDSISANNRFLQIESKDRNGVNIFSYSFDTSSTAFTLSSSQVLGDSVYSPTPNSSGQIQWFGISDSIYPGQLYKLNTSFGLTSPSGFPPYNRIFFGGLNHRNDYRLVGIAGEFDERKDGIPVCIRRYIHYVKKGNSTWGTPLVIADLAGNHPEQELRISPNPTTGFLSIESEAKFDRITIRDIKGRTVFDQDFNPQINLSEFDSGIYLIQLINDQGITTKKIIKD